MGLSEPRAVAMLWALAAAGAVIGIMLDAGQSDLAAVRRGRIRLRHGRCSPSISAGIRVYDDGELAANQRPLTPLVVDIMYKRRVAEVLLDFCLITASYYMAYRLRFEDPEEFLMNFTNFSQSLPVIVASQLVAFFIVGVYRGVWRYFSITDTIVMARGVFVGVVTSSWLILYLYRFTSYSRAVFVIDARVADGFDDAVACVVSPRRRLPQPAAGSGRARRGLRRRRRRNAGDPRAAKARQGAPHRRVHRRCVAQDRDAGARLSRARRVRAAGAPHRCRRP